MNEAARGGKTTMKTFNVYECYRGEWVYWMTVHAEYRGQAEAMILGSNPPARFRIEEILHNNRARLPR